MSEHTLVLLVCLAVIGLLAALFYTANRGQIAALTGLCDVRQALQQILANTQTLERTMCEQRRVINDAHKKITAVSKGVIKPAK
jgi:Na+-translocating ferredoxin:NAD+ oxidoreductase RnfG subunit